MSPNCKLLNIIKGENIESIITSLKYILELKRKYNRSHGEKGANIIALNCSWGKDDLPCHDFSEWCTLYDSLGMEGILCVTAVSNDFKNIDIYGDMPASCQSDFLLTVTQPNAGYGIKAVDIAMTGDGSYTMLNNEVYGYFGGTSASTTYVTSAISLLYAIPKGISEFNY